MHDDMNPIQMLYILSYLILSYLILSYLNIYMDASLGLCYTDASLGLYGLMQMQV